MKARIVSFFRFKHIRTQDSVQPETIIFEVPSKRMLCTLSPEETRNLYIQLDELYTQTRGRKDIDVVMPRVESLIELSNIEMLMGGDRPVEVAEVPQEPEPMFKGNDNEGWVFCNKKSMEMFIQNIQKYIDQKIAEAVTNEKIKGGRI